MTLDGVGLLATFRGVKFKTGNLGGERKVRTEDFLWACERHVEKAIYSVGNQDEDGAVGAGALKVVDGIVPTARCSFRKCYPIFTQNLSFQAQVQYSDVWGIIRREISR